MSNILQKNEKLKVLKNELAGSSEKKLARKRINSLFDDGTFIETNLFSNYQQINNGYVPEGVITGYGQINGRLVYVYSQDATVLNGAFGKFYAEKILKCQEDAMKVGAPLISICDTAGAKLLEGIDILDSYAKIISNEVELKNNIIQIAVLVGSCDGISSLIAGMNDFIFMIDDKSHMFINGPQVVKSSIDNLTLESLGGAKVNAEVSGMADFHFNDENICIAKVRELLSYLPQNCNSNAELLDIKDDLNRVCPKLDDIIPIDNHVFDMKKVIIEIADENKFFEVDEDFSKNIIIGFIHLGGESIGLIANNSIIDEGKLNISACMKVNKFINICDAFNIPILTLVDCDGFLASQEEENRGLIRYVSNLIYNFKNSNVPKITVIVRKDYGGAYVTMCPKNLGADVVFALSSAKIGLMDADAWVNSVCIDEIKNSKNAQLEKTQKISNYEDNILSPYVAASKNLVDDIVEPSLIRKMLIANFDMLFTKLNW